MVDLPRAGRSGVVLLLALVGLFDVLSLLYGVRSVRRLRARVVSEGEQRLAAIAPQLAAPLARGGRAGWGDAAALALRLDAASEVEVLDAAGRVLLSRPGPAPVRHTLKPEEQRRLAAAGRLTVVALDGPAARVLGYLPLPADGAGSTLRLAAPAGDLEDALREQQQAFLGHLASLGALALALLLVLRRERPVPAAQTAALDAYEQAMEKLRDRREEIEARHQVERRRMEDSLQEKEALARAGELTAGIVHEVRNGLGTIVGYALLLERSGLGPDPAAAARSIRAECESLETVVRRFTDYVRLEELQLVPTDLARLLNRVAARELRGHDSVEVLLSGIDHPFEILADEEMLERAFENVVRNAVEAAGAGLGHVWIDVRGSEGHCEVLVQDDGPGLAPDHPGEIRPFYTTRPGGLGLGLPLADKIVRLHGGALRLEPRGPSGLSVTVTLPPGATPALRGA